MSENDKNQESTNTENDYKQGESYVPNENIQPSEYQIITRGLCSPSNGGSFLRNLLGMKKK